MTTIIFRTLGLFGEDRHAIDIKGVVEEYEIPKSLFKSLWANPNRTSHNITWENMNINDWVMLS